MDWGYTKELYESIINLSTAMVVVPTAETIMDVITNNPDIQEMVPYTHGNEVTKQVNVRCIAPRSSQVGQAVFTSLEKARVA